MEITLRPVTMEDAQAVFDLRKDVRLKGMQHALWWFESPHSFAQLTNPGPTLPEFGILKSTILVDGVFAGNITQVFQTTFFDSAPNSKEVGLSWNLRPELWGKRIMPRALSLLVSDLYKIDPDLEFVALCFESNKRCRRVIQKLGFVQERLSLKESIDNFLISFRFHRIMKYRLRPEDWKQTRLRQIANVLK